MKTDTKRRHPRTPCSNCPYRKDAPKEHWHRIEFEKVLASERDQLGSLFACHKHVKLPLKERGMCAGWLLNQKARGIPSIALRLSLVSDPHVVEALKKVRSRGLPMYRSIAEMCRANKVNPGEIIGSEDSDEQRREDQDRIKRLRARSIMKSE